MHFIVKYWSKFVDCISVIHLHVQWKQPIKFLYVQQDWFVCLKHSKKKQVLFHCFLYNFQGAISKYSRSNTTLIAILCIYTDLSYASHFFSPIWLLYIREWRKSRLPVHLFTNTLNTPLDHKPALDKRWLYFSSNENKAVQGTVLLSFTM